MLPNGMTVASYHGNGLNIHDHDNLDKGGRYETDAG